MSVRKEKKIETRNVLKEAAVRVFHEKGIHDARVSDIVACAGVSQGTFYNYFKSKESVFKCIADDYLAHYGQLFADYADLFLDVSDPEEMIIRSQAFMRQLLLSCRDNITTAQLVFGEGAGSAGPYYETCQNAIEHFVSLIRHVVDEARKRGFIVFDDSEMAAAMLFGLFQRCMFYFILGKNEFDIERFEQGLLAFILGGIGWRYSG